MRYLILLCCLMILMGCKKSDGITDCVAAFLAEQEMTPYVDQEIECQFFYELYEYKNKQYFLLVNHCVDMVSAPVDCDGNGLCDEVLKCEDFYNNAVNMGIVGIE